MKFSDLAFDFVAEQNPLYELKARKEADAEPIVDLVRANLSEAEILFPQQLFGQILSEALGKAAYYKPDSFGQKIARSAIANFYAEQGEHIDSENILLTPGTSISFLYCFKLLGNPGDEILCPSPSYPLLDYIAMMSHLKMVPYKLLEEKQWCIDMEDLVGQITDRTRAIVLISPHNPTGMYASAEEIKELAQIARKHNLAIIADEVFSEFLFEPPASAGKPSCSGTASAGIDAKPSGSSAASSGMDARQSVSDSKSTCTNSSEQSQSHFDSHDHSSSCNGNRLPRFLNSGAPLVFTLNGLSKSFALPGVKIGWILISGDDAQVTRSRAALEMISDTFLPVNEIMQFALPDILEKGKSFLKDLQATILRHRELTLAELSGCPLVPPKAGFYLTLPVLGDEEEVAMDLLERKNILVHPGHYYEIEGNHLVLAFVHKEAQLALALKEVRQYC